MRASDGSVEFSINYSVEAAELLSAGKIRVDRLKCADWPDMIAAARKLAPVYVHFPFDLGSRSGREGDLARADAMARETDTPYVNFHVVSYDRDFPEFPTEADEPSMAETFLDWLIYDVEQAAKRLGKERVIIENIPYFAGAGEFHRHSVLADVITRAVRETGVGFLLDVSHARIAAHYLGVEPRAYIDSLPVDQLRELHVTGIRPHKNRLADHMELGEEDWKFFEWAMGRIREGAWAKPWMVAFEYGGVGEPFKWRSKPEVIEEQTPRLYEAVKSV